MTFMLNDHLRNNLISGYHNGSFTKEQVTIFAMNYLNKAQITNDDFKAINEVLYPSEHPDMD